MIMVEYDHLVPFGTICINWFNRTVEFFMNQNSIQLWLTNDGWSTNQRWLLLNYDGCHYSRIIIINWCYGWSSAMAVWWLPAGRWCEGARWAQWNNRPLPAARRGALNAQGSAMEDYDWDCFIRQSTSWCKQCLGSTPLKMGAMHTSVFFWTWPWSSFLIQTSGVTDSVRPWLRLAPSWKVWFVKEIGQAAGCQTKCQNICQQKSQNRCQRKCQSHVKMYVKEN